MLVMPSLDSLTRAERRVAELVSRGATNRQIAEELFVTAKTVEAHLARTYRKLGLANRTQLAIVLHAEPQLPNGAEARRSADPNDRQPG
jgi:DNA-binding NarL/FixJ family response regulator